MQEVNPAHSAQANEQRSYQPVPAARPLSDFSMERIGNDVVLFDETSMQYHTLNDLAFRVWRQCETPTSVGSIAAELTHEGVDVHVDAVELAVAQLVEAGLMQADVQSVDVRIQRRKVLKLAAAGAIAAVSVPVVSSITAPDAAAQNTELTCPDGKKCPVTKCCCCHDDKINPLNCDCSCKCDDPLTSCTAGQTDKFCVAPS